MTHDGPQGRPAIVTGATQAKQAGDIRDRWCWVAHGVWTDRMLTRLEQSEPTTVWLRRRLRAVLRKREKRPGYGLSEADSRRWPNRWFAARGLFSLEYGSCA